MASQAKDTTFLQYTPEQAATYAKYRARLHKKESETTYDANFYNFIFDHHAAAGGRFNRVLDIGCGTGQATRDLALNFDEVYAVDGSSAMLKAAEDLGGITKAGNPIQWRQYKAEEIEGLITSGTIAKGSVDLITAAMAAHWFDMPRFWPAAAQLLRPGGTVAFWCVSSIWVHPDTPDREKLNEILRRFERDTLAPYTHEGNLLTRHGYKDLQMPWQCDRPEPSFPKEGFVRQTWDEDGVLSETQPREGKEDIDFFSGSGQLTTEQLGLMIGTSSPVTRWREDHPDMVGTDKDILNEMLAELQDAMKAHGLDKLRIGFTSAMLLFRRK